MADNKNFYTVIALAKVMKLEYQETYLILKRAGRRDNYGFRLSEWLSDKPWAEMRFKSFCVSKDGEYKAQRIDRLNRKALLVKFPFGRFICHTKSHVIALVNGQIYDNLNMKRYAIRRVWQVFPEHFNKEEYLPNQIMADEIAAGKGKL